MSAADDIKFMGRCIGLAYGAEGFSYPNPLVGSVIVHEGKIIGEGYHLRSGEAHAEVIAINSVKNRQLLKGSTLYVNLEPCSHFGKTPPCADFIIKHSIPRIVVGTQDPSDKVSGKGISRLRDAGFEVIVGVAEAECRRLNRRFFTFHEKKRPYITLKWAQSADSYIDIQRSDDLPAAPNWITGKSERVLVHRWRAMEQAILVGAGTIRADNPGLDVREWTGASPLRLILSSSGSVTVNKTEACAVRNTVVFTHNAERDIDKATIVKLSRDSESAVQIVKYLFDAGIQSLFIEGGATVLNHFISLGLWDEARVFTGKKCFYAGIKAPEISGKIIDSKSFVRSSLVTYLNH